jgi:hypothetical protein
MKSLLTLVLLCTSFSGLAEEIKVTKMSPDGEMDRSFVLATFLPEKVVLDCQSFVQGLRVGEQEHALFFLLEPDDCEAMQKRVKSSLRRRQYHCIDVEADIRSDYSCS